MTGALVRLDRGRVARLTLQGPRANALEPGLLEELHRALDRVEADDPDAVILGGGRNFCSGGDVARFHAAATAGEARAYAARVVPRLQDALFRLVSLSAPVILAARGAMTGGGAGFLFAADLAVLAPDAFVQPYYTRMGFAPDGGWTAILPDRIGAARAAAWIMADRREGAAALCGMGLAEAVRPDPERAASDLLADADPDVLRRTKALFRDRADPALIHARLNAETEAFLDLIDRAETRRRMAVFLGQGDTAHV